MLELVLGRKRRERGTKKRNAPIPAKVTVGLEIVIRAAGARCICQEKGQINPKMFKMALEKSKFLKDVYISRKK